MPPNSDEVLRSVAYVKRGKNRLKVLHTLAEPTIPSEIMLLVYGKYSESYFATVSRALAELQEAKLVELLNPEERTGRMYRATTLGKSVLGFLDKEKARRVIKKADQ
jgi:DNA-binding transcriptional ArsR family regulator